MRMCAHVCVFSGRVDFRAGRAGWADALGWGWRHECVVKGGEGGIERITANLGFRVKHHRCYLGHLLRSAPPAAAAATVPSAPSPAPSRWGARGAATHTAGHWEVLLRKLRRLQAGRHSGGRCDCGQIPGRGSGCRSASTGVGERGGERGQVQGVVVTVIHWW